MSTLNILDACSGSGEWANCWRNNFTYNVCIDSVDIIKTGEHVNFVCDFRDFNPNKEYHIVYFSPPCNKFSRLNLNPTEEEIKKAKELSDLAFYYGKKAKLCYIIENPATGLMPRLYPEENFQIVDYSEYGFPMRKRTAIWSNVQFGFKTKKEISYNRYPISYIDKKERAKIPKGVSKRVKEVILKRFNKELQEFKKVKND